jgi:hypothetical protein
MSNDPETHGITLCSPDSNSITFACQADFGYNTGNNGLSFNDNSIYEGIYKGRKGIRCGGANSPGGPVLERPLNADNTGYYITGSPVDLNVGDIQSLYGSGNTYLESNWDQVHDPDDSGYRERSRRISNNSSGNLDISCGPGAAGPGSDYEKCNSGPNYTTRSAFGLGLGNDNPDVNSDLSKVRTMLGVKTNPGAYSSCNEYHTVVYDDGHDATQESKGECKPCSNDVSEDIRQEMLPGSSQGENKIIKNLRPGQDHQFSCYTDHHLKHNAIDLAGVGTGSGDGDILLNFADVSDVNTRDKYFKYNDYNIQSVYGPVDTDYGVRPSCQQLEDDSISGNGCCKDGYKYYDAGVELLIYKEPGVYNEDNWTDRPDCPYSFHESCGSSAGASPVISARYQEWQNSNAAQASSTQEKEWYISKGRNKCSPEKMVLVDDCSDIDLPLSTSVGVDGPELQCENHVKMTVDPRDVKALRDLNGTDQFSEDSAERSGARSAYLSFNKRNVYQICKDSPNPQGASPCSGSNSYIKDFTFNEGLVDIPATQSEFTGSDGLRDVNFLGGGLSPTESGSFTPPSGDVDAAWSSVSDSILPSVGISLYEKPEVFRKINYTPDPIVRRGEIKKYVYGDSLYNVSEGPEQRALDATGGDQRQGYVDWERSHPTTAMPAEVARKTFRDALKPDIKLYDKTNWYGDVVQPSDPTYITDTGNWQEHTGGTPGGTPGQSDEYEWPPPKTYLSGVTSELWTQDEAIQFRNDANEGKPTRINPHNTKFKPVNFVDRNDLGRFSTAWQNWNQEYQCKDGTPDLDQCRSGLPRNLGFIATNDWGDTTDWDGQERDMTVFGNRPQDGRIDLGNRLYIDPDESGRGGSNISWQHFDTCGAGEDDRHSLQDCVEECRLEGQDNCNLVWWQAETEPVGSTTQGRCCKAKWSDDKRAIISGEELGAGGNFLNHDAINLNTDNRDVRFTDFNPGQALSYQGWTADAAGSQAHCSCPEANDYGLNLKDKCEYNRDLNDCENTVEDRCRRVDTFGNYCKYNEFKYGLNRDELILEDTPLRERQGNVAYHFRTYDEWWDIPSDLTVPRTPSGGEDQPVQDIINTWRTSISLDAGENNWWENNMGGGEYWEDAGHDKNRIILMNNVKFKDP